MENALRTRNGVAQIKCGLEHVLPFLLDGPCHAILARAHVVYLTRGDLLGQAISRHRAITAGVHQARGAETATGAEAPFSLEAIHAQLEHLTQTMAAYEKVFTVLNIRPMRITYEQITAETGHVVRDIARLVGVGVKPAAISGLDAGGHKKVSGSNNDMLRARFLAEAPARAFAATR